ncbi:MAG: hypothetical protein HGA42_20645 [Nostocales cyanobacterium W4_Combined_metabat2_030]|nr:hypothetical protein [Nostocales cyanobacterium W4_Combined_metabat2_030]
MSTNAPTGGSGRVAKHSNSSISSPGLLQARNASSISAGVLRLVQFILWVEASLVRI